MNFVHTSRVDPIETFRLKKLAFVPRERVRLVGQDEHACFLLRLGLLADLLVKVIHLL